MGSKRGSRWSSFLTVTTSRRRETAFFDDNSAGACLEERENSRVSFLPVFRSWASALVKGHGFVCRTLGATAESSLALCLHFPRVPCARAKAPKEIVPTSSSAWRDSSSESYFCCLSFAYKIGSYDLTPSGSTFSALAVEAAPFSKSLAKRFSTEMSEGGNEAAITS